MSINFVLAWEWNVVAKKETKERERGVVKEAERGNE